MILLQGGKRLLPAFHEDLSARAQSDLEKMGVEVRTEARVSDISEESVTYTHDGESITIASKLIIWAAGVKANPLATELATACGQKPGRGGHVSVDTQCRVGGYANIFAIGDCANYHHETERPLPGVAQVAIQQGKYVAKLISNHIVGRPTSPFQYFDKGSMATIGANRAVLESGWLRLTGPIAWLGWLGVHLMFIVSRENRFLILLQWFWNWWTRGRSARLMTSPRYLEHHLRDKPPSTETASVELPKNTGNGRGFTEEIRAITEPQPNKSASP